MLREGLAVREAVDVAWATTGPDRFRLLVVERGRSRERFQDRVVGLPEKTLFDRAA